jgi:hypothetical protein
MPVPILRSRADCGRCWVAFSASCSLEEEERKLWRSPARSSDVVDALRMMESSAGEECSVSQLDTRRGRDPCDTRLGACTSSGGCGVRCVCMTCCRFSSEPVRGIDGFMVDGLRAPTRGLISGRCRRTRTRVV